MMKSSVLSSLIVLTLLFSGYWLLRTSPDRQLIHYKFRVNKIEHSEVREAMLLEKIEKSPNPFIEAAELGSLYITEGKWTQDETYFAKAKRYAEESHQLQPNNPIAEILFAEIDQAEHRFNEAAVTLEGMVKKGAGGLQPLSLLTTVYLAQGRNVEAFRSAQQIINHQPYSNNIAMRALTLQALGRNEEANYDFKKALELEDFGHARESAWLRAVYGRFLFQREQYGLAEYSLQESLRILPNYSLALQLLAELYQKRGDLVAAKKWAERSFATLPQIRSLRLLAEIEQGLGHRENATKFFTEAESSARKDLAQGLYGHQLELVRVLLGQGDPEKVKEAVDLAKKEITVRKNAETWYWLAKAQFAAGLFPDAYQSAWEMLNAGERRKEFVEFMAAVEAKLGRNARAKLYTTIGKSI